MPLLGSPQQVVIYYNLESSSIDERVYRTGKVVFSLSRATTPLGGNFLDDFTTGVSDTLESQFQWTSFINTINTYYEIRIQQTTTYDIQLSYHYTVSVY